MDGVGLDAERRALNEAQSAAATVDAEGDAATKWNVPALSTADDADGGGAGGVVVVVLDAVNGASASRSGRGRAAEAVSADRLSQVVPERVLNAASDYSVRSAVDIEPCSGGSAANVCSKRASGSASGSGAERRNKAGFGPKRRLNPKQKAKCKVFVEGINGSIGGNQLRVKFEKFGTVICAKILRDPSTSASRGCGFVTFKSKKSADRAIKMMDGESWYSQSLRVQSVHELSASTSISTSPSAAAQRAPTDSVSTTTAMATATESESMTQQIGGAAVIETAPNSVDPQRVSVRERRSVCAQIGAEDERADRERAQSPNGAQKQSGHRFGGGMGSDRHVPPWRPPPVPAAEQSRDRSNSYLNHLGLAAEQCPISTHSTAAPTPTPTAGGGLLYGGINPLIAAAQFPSFCIPRIVADPLSTADSVPIPNPPLLQQSFAAMDAEYRRFKMMAMPIPNVVNQQSDGLPLRPQLRATVVVEKQSETETAADDHDGKEGVVPLSPPMAVPSDLKLKSMSISQSVSPSQSASKSPTTGRHGVRSFSPPSDRGDSAHSDPERDRDRDPKREREWKSKRSISPNVSDRERDRLRRRPSPRRHRHHRRRRDSDRRDRSRSSSRQRSDRRDRSRSRSRQRESDRMRWRMRMRMRERERMRRSPSPRPYLSRSRRRSRSRSRSGSRSRSRRYSRSPLRSRGRSRRRSPSMDRDKRSRRNRSRSRDRSKSRKQSDRKEGTVEDGEIDHHLHRRRSSRSRSRSKVKLSGFPPEYKLRQKTVAET